MTSNNEKPVIHHPSTSTIPTPARHNQRRKSPRTSDPCDRGSRIFCLGYPPNSYDHLLNVHKIFRANFLGGKILCFLPDPRLGGVCVRARIILPSQHKIAPQKQRLSGQTHFVPVCFTSHRLLQIPSPHENSTIHTISHPTRCIDCSRRKARGLRLTKPGKSSNRAIESPTV